ncbi:response regulator transcription factor [Campylobacter sp. RM9344]|uniref:Response regulator transcription factor n=1 Tax=Campylobacter californiensis TaxID=1032243 RepID=A0AAW3ZYK0_9BACT|nr:MULTISPECIES: response regulator transcription factor [unclassified Campylobacter]MBE2985268.1 response regulator transcription factor [Campylobacter sp. RM6883]MBE2986367.1 response regulator transcription factor [Campylobacter sp. RM12919]MBE2988002.1 response regulator transcription factor [Campylobacter sp. RM12920]MBE2995921.1 response regulator transcription factor [Campylobacter sp. RM6913]MBE3030022.1 response regulator transcription factor [Campylobacter sp. RM9344]
MKILLLEDDIQFQESVCEYLQMLGYDVDCASDGQKACDLIASNFYHLFILDIKVPKISGHEVIKYIKNLNLNTPIMITTSLVDIDDMAIGYELGCNEYLKKPFELAELKFRVAELMRKYYSVDDKNVIKLNGGFEFNTSKRVLQKDGALIDLSAKETDLVECLVSHLNMYVSMDELREFVWGDKEIDGADIRMHVLKIRQKTSNEFITSKRRVGYKING